MENGFIILRAFECACETVAHKGGWAMAVVNDCPCWHEGQGQFDISILFPRYDSWVW